MRIRALLIAITAAVCTFIGIVANPPIASAHECPRPTGELVAYGHSYLHSPEIGGASASYVTIAAHALGMIPAIRAVNGYAAVDVASLVRGGPTRWVPGSAHVVLIDSAINDIVRSVPTGVWTGALRRMLRMLSSAPAPVILLVVPLRVSQPGHPGRNPMVIAAYVNAQRRVARDFPTVHLVDASVGWNPSVDISSEGVHPTQAGERHLAEAVQRTTLSALCQCGRS